MKSVQNNPDFCFRRNDTLFIAAFILLLMTGFTLWCWLQPGVPFGIQDPDVWLRLVRVEQLYISGEWYDRTMVRLNAPYGLENHWTRPLDVFLLILAWPASFFMPFKQALLAASVLCNAILWWLAIAGALSLCRALKVGIVGQWMALILMLTDGFVRGGLAIGRADHHGLLLVIFAWMLAMLARSRFVVAGLIAGLGLWVAPEFLVAIACVLAWLAGGWMVSGDTAKLRQALRFSLLALIVALIAAMLEWEPDAWLSVSHERISLGQLSVLGAAALCLRVLYGAQAFLRRPAMRAALALGLALAALIVLQHFFPRFYEGPMAGTPPELMRVFSSEFAELRPMWGTYGILGTLGMVALCMATLCIYWSIIQGACLRFSFWWLTALATLVYAALHLYQVRWGGYASLAAIMAWAWLADAMKEKLSGRMRGALAPALAGILLVLSVRQVLVLPAMATAPASASASSCMRTLIQKIEWNQLKLTPTTIATHTDVAAQLLFWTPHSAIASNYNYNAQGIMELDRLLFARDAREAKQVIEARKVGAIAVCMDALGAPFFAPYERAEPYFLRQAQAGNVPGWLEKVPGNWPKELLFLRVK